MKHCKKEIDLLPKNVRRNFGKITVVKQISRKDKLHRKKYMGDKEDVTLCKCATISQMEENNGHQYALSIPVKLNSGEMGKACMNLQCFNDMMDLNVVLQYNGINTTIFSVLVSPPSYFQCIPFLTRLSLNSQVPVVQEDVPVLVLLNVSREGMDILQRYTVVITVQSNIYLVQMDKPIYKPGQNVLFNLISLNPQLLPVNETYSKVYLTDPSGSRIAQWLNVEGEAGFASLQYPLVDDATPGSYYVTALRASDQVVMQWFTVEKYVSPRYEVTLDAPYILSILDETVEYTITAKYTYGEPVPGVLSIIWCRERTYGLLNNCYRDKNGVCFNETAQLASDGTYNGKIDLTSIQMDLSGFQTNLNLSVTVTENGTEIQVTKTQYFWMTSQLARISFDYEHMNQYYKRGLPYTVKVLLKDEKDAPIVGEEVQLEIDGYWEIQNIITDSNGAASYEIDTSNFFEPNFTIRASYQNTEQCYQTFWQGPYYPTTEYLVFRFYSVTGSFLKITPLEGKLRCGHDQRIEVQFILNTAEICDGATNASFYYLIISRAQIVHSGHQDVDLTYPMNGTFSFELPISSEMAFKADLIVYSILQKEIISDTLSLNVENCFKNEVSLSFSAEIGPPASNVSLQISASPGSLCAVSVIDSSILLLNPYLSLTPETVYYSLQYWSYGYNVGSFNVEEPGPPCEDPNKQIFFNGNYYVPVSSDTEGDTYQNLKSIGLIVGTDATVRKPEVCRPTVETFPTTSGKPLINEVAETSPPDFAAQTFKATGSMETIRRNFSDTWVWTKVYIDDDGNGTIYQTAPDTITEWKGSMICTSQDDGFGMTKDFSNFTTLLPFFVEMSLPYSFKRGEILVLVASVSNYLDLCIKIQVNLSTSDDYIAKVQEGEQDTCICTGKKAYYKWNINATTLGVTNFTISAQTTHIGETCSGKYNCFNFVYKDTVSQSLIIEPEGIQKEVTSSHLICLQGNSSQNDIKLELFPPPDIVPDSASGSITVVGDLVGLPLQNLQNLVQMPFGCGEQNLARLAPIPVILDYLAITDQLTNEFLQRGIQFMSIGYARELQYRLWSGAYSLFSGVNSEPNSWLTVNVFKTFNQCKKYIYIDDKIQQQTLIWLENLQQLESGCFNAIGDPFMREATDNDVTYTAFLAIACLESNYSLGMTLLSGALTCLQNVVDTNTDLSVYQQAIMAYAFTLAQDWPRRESLLTSLKSKAIEEGGTIHWERDDKPAPQPGFYPSYSPAEVQSTAYVLLSYAVGPNATQELTYMGKISVWLIRQQNPYGGFLCTADTVVTLQALSAFAKYVFTPNAHQTIKVTGQNEITVNKLNRFLVQTLPLSVTGDYDVSINGTGCCLVQSTLRYNVPVPQVNSSFLLSANTSSTSCVNGVAYTFAIGIRVSFRGNRSQTNMVVIDVAIVSGYETDYWSLQELVNSKVISNFETKNNHVYLYLKSVSRETTYFSVNVIMGNRVLNVKHASIYVYDYYETGIE
ncbi:ovostatin-like [Phyllobates terribilis]|uniref:ovostatin-like n=1 Tax=Phyllobates terribilis TaxID=111132 RepID=UPI003CCA7614